MNFLCRTWDLLHTAMDHSGEMRLIVTRQTGNINAGDWICEVHVLFMGVLLGQHSKKPSALRLAEQTTLRSSGDYSRRYCIIIASKIYHPTNTEYNNK